MWPNEFFLLNSSSTSFDFDQYICFSKLTAFSEGEACMHEHGCKLREGVN